MTVFDVLMPSLGGVPGGSAAGAKSGVTGDWRQAMEQAQTRFWLRDRNLTPGGNPLPGLPGAASASPLPHRVEPRLASTLAPARQSAIADADRPVSSTAPRPAAQALSVDVQARLASVSMVSMPMVSAMPWSGTTSDGPPAAIAPLAAAAAHGEELRGRARRQSIHVETGEQGVSVWIRDTSLNSQEARHLAAAIAAAVSSGQQILAAFYLNGRPLADGSESFSSLLSE